MVTDGRKKLASVKKYLVFALHLCWPAALANVFFAVWSIFQLVCLTNYPVWHFHHLCLFLFSFFFFSLFFNDDVKMHLCSARVPSREVGQWNWHLSPEDSSPISTSWEREEERRREREGKK